MFNEARIKEARVNTSAYLSEGLLKKISIKEPSVMKILLANSKESLSVAEFVFSNNKSNLWTIICSYYSMYYMANAVLYNLGIKVGDKVSHKVTADALFVYVKEKLKASLLEDYEEAKAEALEISGNKADEMIEQFDVEREKRSKFQYSTTETALRSKANTSLERAKRFVFEMEKLVLE